MIVDANAIVQGPWRLDSAAWRILLYQAKCQSIRLVVPEVVVREAVGRYSGELTKRLAAAASAAQDVQDLTGVPVATPDVAPRDHVAAYEADLRGKLTQCGVEIPQLPQVDVSALVDRAIYRRKPFDDKGSGFRDSLLWETTIEVLREPHRNEDAYLVSNDHNAFSESSQSITLHHDLVSELSERGVTITLILVKDVLSYLNSEELGEAKDTVKIIEDLEAQHTDLVSLVEAILANAELEPGQILPTTGRIVNVSDVKVIFVRAAGDEDPLLLQLLIETRAQLELHIGGAESPSTNIRVALRMFGTAAYTPGDHSFSDLSLDVPGLVSIPEVIVEVNATQHVDSLRGPLSVFIDANLLEQMHRATAVSIDPAVLEQFRRASEAAVPTGFLEQLRKAIESPIHPSLLEEIRKAAEFSVDPSVMEQFRKAAEFQIDPGVFDQIRRATEFKLPPWPWLYNFSSGAQQPEKNAPPSSGDETVAETSYEENDDDEDEGQQDDGHA